MGQKNKCCKHASGRASVNFGGISALEILEDVNMKEYIIQPKSGIRIDVDKGQKIEIIDVEGGQVADFLQIPHERRSHSASGGVAIPQ